jgi:hypothetical protein
MSIRESTKKSNSNPDVQATKRTPFPGGLSKSEFTAAKLRWLDEMSGTRPKKGIPSPDAISDFAFRVLYKMASKYLNQETGTAYVGHKRRAEDVGGTRQGVQRYSTKLLPLDV